MLPCKSAIHKRRIPEKSTLYKILQAHLECWLSEYVLGYVEKKIREYIKCGILSHGFARARCEDCGHDFIIALSCKKRVCPSCSTKYMEITSAHITDNIFPKVAVRQFVLSLPERMRYFTARDSALSRKVLKIFIDAIERQYKKNAVVATSSQIGEITFIQTLVQH